jgi:UDP-glucose:tetrahydrobiopterin glucosyltransferase
MKIALIAPLVSPIAPPFIGGAQAMVADLAQGLFHRGHHVTLFAREGSYVPGVPIEQIPVPESVCPSDFSVAGQERRVDPGFFAQANLFLELFLQLRLRQQEFDVIHVHAFDWPAFACSTLVQSVPVMHTIHLPAVSPEINEALRVLHLQQHPLTLVTVSDSCAHSYADYTPFDYVIYNGLDLDAIPFAAQVADDAPLLFAGRISPEKGVVEAIEIAHLAGRPLLIAGGIYHRRYYEEQIEPLLQQEQGRVTYLGHLEHAALWKLMGQSLGLLFPIAWDEPFGLVLVEAMATGTPVIAFEHGAAGEVIRHGETGFLIASEDCKGAAALVDKLPSLSRTRCRAHVAENFSLVHTLYAYEYAYSEIVRQGRSMSDKTSINVKD